MPYEILVERVEQLAHRQLAFFEDERADRGQGIDDGAKAHHIEEAEVEGAFDRPRVNVFATAHAEVVQHRKHR